MVGELSRCNQPVYLLLLLSFTHQAGWLQGSIEFHHLVGLLLSICSTQKLIFSALKFVIVAWMCKAPLYPLERLFALAKVEHLNRVYRKALFFSILDSLE